VFDYLFDFSFADPVLAFVKGDGGDAAALGRYLEARERAGNTERFIPFLDTHDTPGFLYRAGGDRDALVLAATLEMTVPGAPLIYYGDELGREGGEWPQNRSDMPWGTGEDVRRKYEQLTTAHDWLHAPLRVLLTSGAAIAYSRGRAVVAVNAGRRPATLHVAIPPHHRERLGWGARVGDGVIDLPPRSAAIVTPLP
jgi:alpha-amylase